MAFLETHVFSQALEVAVTVNVLLPEPSQGIGLEGAKAQEPPRVMYLLHGYSDDQSIWMRRTSVERYCAKYNLAVIMPAVNHSYYANELQGERYWDYVSQELPQMMHSMFRLSQAPGTELVAGLSMGGYGAMKLALTYPERFAAAASFSGAVDAEALLRKREPRPTMRRAFGTAKAFHGSKNDLFHLMEENAQAPTNPGSTWPAARRISSSAIIKSLFPPWRKTAGTLPTRKPPALATNGPTGTRSWRRSCPLPWGTEAAHGSRKA